MKDYTSVSEKLVLSPRMEQVYRDILPRIKSGEWQRVLFLRTGALLSKTRFNEGLAVPGIAHAVVLEHV